MLKEYFFDVAYRVASAQTPTGYLHDAISTWKQQKKLQYDFPPRMSACTAVRQGALEGAFRARKAAGRFTGAADRLLGTGRLGWPEPYHSWHSELTTNQPGLGVIYRLILESATALGGYCGAVIGSRSLVPDCDHPYWAKGAKILTFPAVFIPLLPLEAARFVTATAKFLIAGVGAMVGAVVGLARYAWSSYQMAPLDHTKIRYSPCDVVLIPDDASPEEGVRRWNGYLAVLEAQNWRRLTETETRQADRRLLHLLSYLDEPWVRKFLEIAGEPLSNVITLDHSFFTGALPPEWKDCQWGK